MNQYGMFEKMLPKSIFKYTMSKQAQNFNFTLLSSLFRFEMLLDHEIRESIMIYPDKTKKKIYGDTIPLQAKEILQCPLE